MLKFYFVKQDLWGIPAGTVERFADYKAGELLVAGKIEPYDEKKHGEKEGSPKFIAEVYERRRRAFEARIAEQERRSRLVDGSTK